MGRLLVPVDGGAENLEAEQSARAVARGRMLNPRPSGRRGDALPAGTVLGLTPVGADKSSEIEQ